MLAPDVADKVRQLLDTLDPLDLADIAATSCGNAVQCNGKNDYIRVILAYHSSAAEILARRKLKREYLIKYLWSCNLAVSLSLSKTEAVVRLLNHWRLDEQAARQQAGAFPQLQQPQQRLEQQRRHLGTSLHQSQDQASSHSADDSSQPVDPELRDFLARLSRAFAEFFFSAYQSPTGVPPAVFEPSCDFVVELGGPAMPQSSPLYRESHQSADLASRGLAELRRVHDFLLQPNLVNGLSAEMSSFGLVRFQADCSLHQSAGNRIGLARLHCLLAPRLADASAPAATVGHDCYAVRALRLLLYLESAGVPRFLSRGLPPQETRPAIQ